MADKSGSFKSRQYPNRRSLTMRRVKDEDARRVARRDDGEELVGGHAELSSRLTMRGTASGRAGQPPGKGGVSAATGRQVLVTREDAVSGRFSSARLAGDSARSVRVHGGDTIVRYASGDMVIRRGARRSLLRRQAILVYAAGYLALFGLYAYFLLTGVATVTPEEFVNTAFSQRRSTGIVDLERAALEVMRGNRTPAEIRVAQPLSFYDENRDPVHVAAGDRLTLLTASRLARAILDEADKPEAVRTFTGPIRVYRETYLAQLDWPYILTFYNALGFFLLVGLFLWRPITMYLGTQGRKTAAALRTARDAGREAEEYREKYRRLAAEIEEKSGTLRAAADKRGEAERAAVLERAEALSAEMAEGADEALRREAALAAEALGSETVRAACDRAKEIVRGRVGRREHDAAVDELIADITGMRFTR